MEGETLQPFIDLSPEVAEALAGGTPIVALETAVVTHGLPPPFHLQAIEQMENAIRQEGAIPATIGVLQGRIRIGLSGAELALLVKGEPHKAAGGDLAMAVAKGLDAGLTVSGTLAVARLVHIPVLATGGIGGVHRGGARTWDVSRDLYELARTPMAVVCSGAKIICDVPLTLELLESLGIGVVGYQTETFPYFYLRSSGYPLSTTVQGPEEVAMLLLIRQRLHQPEGILVAHPVPEEAGLDACMVEEIMEVALKKAKAERIRSKALTPFLLDTLHALTHGATVGANLALLAANARVAAQISISYMALRRRPFHTGEM